MHLVECNEERHAGEILAIFNEAIVNSTALYDYKPRAPETMVAWFATKRANGFPVIGMEDDSGKLLGFASYGTFRAFPAYKYTVEHSVYVEKKKPWPGPGAQAAGGGDRQSRRTRHAHPGGRHRPRQQREHCAAPTPGL